MNAYQIIRELGRGAFGKAYLIQPKNNPNVKYVAKQIDISKASQTDIESIKNEIKMLQTCNHPNVVKYIGQFVESGNQYIITEYCDSGDLERFLEKQKQKGPLSEDEILCYFTQICLAIKHVHDKRVLHRDMKTANLFLTTPPSRNFYRFQIKLGDFGVSKIVQGNQMLTQTFVGTPLYMAPEILQDKPYNNKTDIWSIGCILYNLCTFQQMIQANTMQTLMMRARNNKVPQVTDHYSQKIQQLLEATVQSDPKKRLSAQQLLDLPQLKEWVPRLLTQQQLDQERFNLRSQLVLRPETGAPSSAGATRRPQQNGPKMVQQVPPPQQPNANINALVTHGQTSNHYFSIGVNKANPANQAYVQQPQQPLPQRQGTQGGVYMIPQQKQVNQALPQAPAIPQAPTLPDFNFTTSTKPTYPSNVLQTSTVVQPGQQVPQVPFNNIQTTNINQNQVLTGNPLNIAQNNIGGLRTQNQLQSSTYRIPSIQETKKEQTVVQNNTQVQLNKYTVEQPVVSNKRSYGPQLIQNYGQIQQTSEYNKTKSRSPSPSTTSDFFFQDERGTGFGTELKNNIIKQVQTVIRQYGQEQYDKWKLEMKRNILFGQDIRTIPPEHQDLMISVADFNML